MLRILHLSAVKNWGGGENHIQNLCTDLQRLEEGVENIIFCVKEGRFHQRLKQTSLSFIPAVLDFKMDPRFIARLINVCKSHKIDLIHIHDTTALTLAVMGDHFYNLPPFVLSKKTSFPIKPRKQTLFKYNYSKIKKILCVSKATEAITRERINDQGKIQCIYHGTAINRLPKTNSSLREILNLKNDVLLIGNIGNHIRAKNLQTFIEVAYELVKIRQIKNLHFVQIGDFTDRTAALKAQISRMQLDDHISIMGELADASGFIPQFDIALVTSQSEGLPQFIYEAFYHEVPVVSTNVGGIKELITHRETGLLSPPHDVQGLANSIQELINDQDLKIKFTNNSRETIEQHFTSEMMALQTLEVYKSIINGYN